MSMIRTFIAVDLSPQVTKRAADLVRRLQASGADVKWVPQDQMHLTLKFLGDVPDTETPRVCQAVAQVAAQRAPMELTCEKAGAFPRLDRPRTVWVGIHESPPLAELYQALDDAMHQLGFPKERRRFHPHLTIGRVRKGGASQAELAQLLHSQADFQAGSCEIDEVLVYASFLERSGPSYDVLGRAPLKDLH